MGTTYLHAVASLDGYIADEHDEVGPLFDWYFNGDRPLVDDDETTEVHGPPFRVSAASADYVRGIWSRQKVVVIGSSASRAARWARKPTTVSAKSDAQRHDRVRRSGARVTREDPGQAVPRLAGEADLGAVKYGEPNDG